MLLARSLHVAAHLLWPTRCAGCDVHVGPDDAFCAACDPSVMTIDPACIRCAMPTHGPCQACLGITLPFTQAHAALAYGGAVSQALVRLKHAGRVDLARLLGPYLAAPLAAAVTDIDAVLPVPLHPRKLRQRGYNQALLLARAGLRGVLQAPPVRPGLLVRVRDTPELGHASPTERRARVAAAFAVPDAHRVRGKRFVLVDDVMTTGATARACARTLRDAGAAEVRIVALARAV